MAVCEECGSRRLEPTLVSGIEFEQCGLCGHLHGDPAAVEHMEEIEEARERGFNVLVYPLVRALELVPTFRVASASAGRESTKEFPFVFLRLEAGGLEDLERLLTSLEMANRDTQRRWVVETALQRGLLFILRPRFWKPVHEINLQDIRESRADLGILAETIRRDVNLSWWRG